MTVEVVKVKKRKPIITAIQIPEICTMGAADDIERECPVIKRDDWDARSDRVRRFKVGWSSSASVLHASGTDWVVFTHLPEDDYPTYAVLSDREMRRLYEVK